MWSSRKKISSAKYMIRQTRVDMGQASGPHSTSIVSQGFEILGQYV